MGPQIVISTFPPDVLRLDAPTLTSERVKADGRVLWRVWCRCCEKWHYHGPALGHREAHCRDHHSGYVQPETTRRVAELSEVEARATWWATRTPTLVTRNGKPYMAFDTPRR